MIRPRRVRRLAAGLAVAGAALLAGPPAAAQPTHDDPTVSLDNTRDGWDSQAAALTAPSVGGTSGFGELFADQVDGPVLAQPLIADGHLIVATENDTVYSLDPQTGAVQWQVHLGTAWNAANTRCSNVAPQVGVTATPVYDPSRGVVYLSAKTYTGTGVPQDGDGGSHYAVYALQVSDGAELPGWPVQVTGAPANDPTDHPFDPYLALQRSGLLLANGRLFLGFASNCDQGDYRGYLAVVDTATASLTTLWSDEGAPSGGGQGTQGGIWMSGGGPASYGPDESGAVSVYVVTGNGTSPPPGPGGGATPVTLGDSVVRLTEPSGGGPLTATDFFAPANADYLNTNDLDFGSGGPVLLPPGFGSSEHPDLLVAEGKAGTLFLLDADNLGGREQGPGQGDAALGEYADTGAGMYGHPAAAAFGSAGNYLYTVTNDGALTAWRGGVSGTGVPTLGKAGAAADPVSGQPAAFGYGAGSPVVTSNGASATDALVWVQNRVPGELEAYTAVPDAAGRLELRWAFPVPNATKFTVAASDGTRVYLGGQGWVYGFGPVPPAPVAAVQGTDGGQPWWANVCAGSGCAVHWSALGGSVAGPPAVAAAPAGAGHETPIFVATGSNGRVYVRDPATDWQPLTGSGSCLSPPGAYIWPQAHLPTLFVACRGPGGGLQVTSAALPATGLPRAGTWTNLGGGLLAGPAIAPVGGVLTYFVVGRDDTVYLRAAAPGASFVPGPGWRCSGRPAAAAAGAGTAFACEGSNQALWYDAFTDGGWAPATSLGGVLSGGPGMADSTNGPVFVVSGSYGLWTRTLTDGWGRINGAAVGGAGAAGT